MVRRADDERLAPHSCHEGRLRGLARHWSPELDESGDPVDCYRRVVPHIARTAICGAGIGSFREAGPEPARGHG